MSTENKGSTTQDGVRRYNDKERQQVQDAKPSSAVQRALKAGPHGKAIHADGSKQSDQKDHKVQGPGNLNLPDTTQENYRLPNGIPGELGAGHYGSKERQQGGYDKREPKGKGPAAIDLDSDYENPTGPQSTRAPLPLKKKKVSFRGPLPCRASNERSPRTAPNPNGMAKN